MSVWSRLRTPVWSNTGSVARDHLALERTFLAWLRTGLGFVALGIAIERFSQLDLHSIFAPLAPHGYEAAKGRDEANRRRSERLVGALLGTGVGSISYGTVRYFSTLRLMQNGLYKPAYYGAGLLSLGVAALAGEAYTNLVQEAQRARDLPI